MQNLKREIIALKLYRKEVPKYYKAQLEIDIKVLENKVRLLTPYKV